MLKNGILALVVVILVMGLVEAALRLTGVVADSQLTSPLEFQGIPPRVVVPMKDGALRYDGGHSRVATARPVGKRVILVGGSAAMGHGYSPWAAFGGQVERWLNRAYDEPVEVINLGVGGFALRQARTMAEGALKGPLPDLIIVHSGNNEYHALRGMKYVNPGFDARTELWRRRLFQFHLYRWLRGLLRPSEQQDPEAAHRPSISIAQIPTTATPEDKALVSKLFEAELRDLVSLASKRDIPLVLGTVPTNLVAPPSTVEEWGLTPEEEAHIDQLRQASDPIATLEASQHQLSSPGASLSVGYALLERGHPELARPYLLKAEAADPKPVRADMHIREATRRVAAASDAILCDIEAELAAITQGVPSNDLFDDPCHPNALGHRIIGALYARCLLEAQALGAPDQPALKVQVPTPFSRRPQLNPLRLDHTTLNPLRLPPGLERATADTAAEQMTAGHLRFLRQDPNGAAQAYRRAETLGAPPAITQLNLGLTALYQLDLDRARAHLDAALSGLPPDDDLVDLRRTLGP